MTRVTTRYKIIQTPTCVNRDRLCISPAAEIEISVVVNVTLCDNTTIF